MQETKDNINMVTFIRSDSSLNHNHSSPGATVSDLPPGAKLKGNPPSLDCPISNLNRFKQHIMDYKKNLRHYLLTSRFSTKTWCENENYRSTRENMKCIYCSPGPISCNIPNDSIMFILEMNNDTNKIIGIGMVRNHPILNKYSVYSEGNYNRYVFVGKNRIDRNQMCEEEERIMKVFDILCFTGNKHMKRGQGLKLFPIEMLYRCSERLDLVEFICVMFKNRIINVK